MSKILCMDHSPLNPNFGRTSELLLFKWYKDAGLLQLCFLSCELMQINQLYDSNSSCVLHISITQIGDSSISLDVSDRVYLYVG